MLVTTTNDIEGKELEILGVVFGNTVRAKHIGSDIAAGLKNIIGGELKGYSEMLTQARKEALLRMIEEANKMNADAVVNVRFTTSQTMAGAAELLAYGTAVKIKTPESSVSD
ncbi:YbjQ family protein [Methanolobus halotolerans]|uniref:UPF0145 protein CUN85_04780 n=1 Tax=Methanolobus halotolerans TaxID=2052935 RepID=A0A4E0PWD5_9EURY|nr:YbjQ family protein [Methanolobus halotolerans]TGC09681.1 hypothetical protein CUN85_04780 [Methanolobus halotolerans]